MAVTSDQTRLSIEAGNDVKVAFDFQFKIFAKTDLKCWKQSAAGVRTLGVVDVDYTVSFSAADEEGTVTWAVAPVTDGYSIIDGTEMPLTQGTEFPRDTAIPNATFRNAFDRLTILCQQLSDVLFGRAILWDEDLYLDDREQIVVKEAPVDRRSLVYERNDDDDGWNVVPSAYDPDTAIAAAAASAAAALASQTAAATSAAAAATSAAASATSAAASAASATAAAASATTASTIAAALELSGLYAARPAAPTVTTIYYSTDRDSAELWLPAANRWFLLG